MKENGWLPSAAVNVNLWRYRKMANIDDRLCVAAAIFSFDITVGEGITHLHPPGVALPIPADRLAAIAMPEGSHKVEEDYTFLVVPGDGNGDQVFGLCYVIFRRDPSVPRGAIMKSLVLLARRPFFGFFLPVVRAALLRHLDAGDDTVLATLVTRLNELAAQRLAGTLKADTLTIFGQGPFAVALPATSAPDDFGLEANSLCGLVLRFREHTMLVWWALLLHVRLLFCGHPCGAVGVCCLAAPLLVRPLRGFADALHPYVPLSHPQDVEGSKAGGRYICGVTNSIFGQKRKWYDALASLGSGTVSGPFVDELKIKLSGKEKAFIRNVLSGIERDGRGEAWVREQFRRFTDSFLLELMLDEEQGRAPTRKRAHQQVWRLAESEAFRAYCARQQSSPLGAATGPGVAMASGGGGCERGGAGGGGGASPLEYYTLLRADGLSAAERAKLLFNLHSSLADLDDIEQLVDRGAVRLLSADAFLKSESGTVRKYAIGVLATLASAVRGIVAVLSGGLLPVLVERLTDPMPAVGTAAANCLRRTASLFVGAQALVAEGVVVPLTQLLLVPPTDELLMRTLLASTLLQVYRFLPSAPRLDQAPADIAQALAALPSACRELALLLVELLDVWRCPLDVSKNARLALLLSEVPDAASHVRHLSDAAALSPNAEAHALRRLHADLAARRFLAIPLVLAGAVELLDSISRPAMMRCNDGAHAAVAPLGLQVLAILADTSCGLERLVSLGLLPWLAASQQLLAGDAPAPAAAACRLFTVASQHEIGVAALRPCAAQLRALHEGDGGKLVGDAIDDVLARVAA